MKLIFKLRSLFAALAVLAVLPVGLAQPQLSLLQESNKSVIYWPASAANYSLQSTTNLAAPNWVTVTNAVPITSTDAVALVSATVTNTAPATFYRLYYATPPTGMAFIPAGTFTMGDSLDAESDAVATDIFVSSFFMDANLVTYTNWQTVYSAAISTDTHNLAYGYSFANVGAGKGANYPAESVDWFDCAKWCNARSQLAGLTPVYYTDAGLTQVYKVGELFPYANWAANGYRLPTEAEWEKAARGGLSGQRFPWGNQINESEANYNGNTNTYSYDSGPNGENAIGIVGGTSPATSPVGSFPANGYGLYDMAGNVFEWCWDFYGVPYGLPTGSDPTGPTTGGYYIVRGGSWVNYAYYARCAYRYELVGYAAGYGLGFRCVRSGL